MELFFFHTILLIYLIQGFEFTRGGRLLSPPRHCSPQQEKTSPQVQQTLVHLRHGEFKMQLRVFQFSENITAISFFIDQILKYLFITLKIIIIYILSRKKW